MFINVTFPFINKGKQSINLGEKEKFEYQIDRFADIEILRYKVEGWENLILDQKKLIYCLCEAALCGRDIIFDQNNRYNLAIRRTLEAIYSHYRWKKINEEYKALVIYLKRIWFSNGIHHHYGAEKFLPTFSKDFFIEAVHSLDNSQIPKRKGQSTDDFIEEIIPVMFNPTVYAKKVNQDAGLDVILMSANNYYAENVTQSEVEHFYKQVKDSSSISQLSYGLNSRLVKKNGILTEERYQIGGLYSPAIEKIIFWLKKASTYAENEQQKKIINLLIQFYQTGFLDKYEEYTIQWVKDTESIVDFINGFTETYGDSLGIKGSWQSIVNFKNLKATTLSRLISDSAQWFEDHSPIDPRFKKKRVTGITAKVVTACILGGDCYPSTPVGINLPNSDWIRKKIGSKSVNIFNITDAYNQETNATAFKEEFIYGEKEKNWISKYGIQTNNLHIDLHECIGHASGQLSNEVTMETLKVYSSTIEETRADLFALYFMPDTKMLELGLLSDPEAYKARYYLYLMNGAITQLARIEIGGNVEEAHMRSHALIAHYLLDIGGEEMAKCFQKDKKTYVAIYDYVKMRQLIGDLLSEIQRIKSEGDIEKAQYLIEKYAVHVDYSLHQEILDRYATLDIAPHKGFVNPIYKPIYNKQGNIIDIKIDYEENYNDQMLRYSQDYSYLSTFNE